MALLGAGAICIWNDITPEGRSDFYDWHLTEHMPERAAVPGFLRSRRFIAASPGTQPEFFTLYETRDAAVHTSADYLARLNAPTPWTKSATQAFRNTARALTTVCASLGPGAGASLVTLRFDVAASARQTAIVRIRDQILPAAARLPMMAGAHLCVTDEAASAARTAESRDRTDILAAPGWIILIEACSDQAVAASAANVRSALPEAGVEAAPVEGRYRLEFQC